MTRELQNLPLDQQHEEIARTDDGDQHYIRERELELAQYREHGQPYDRREVCFVPFANINRAQHDWLCAEARKTRGEINIVLANMVCEQIDELIREQELAGVDYSDMPF
jgi:hypothetical protein